MNKIALVTEVVQGTINPRVRLQSVIRTTMINVVDGRVPESGLRLGRLMIEYCSQCEVVLELGGGKYAPVALSLITGGTAQKALVVEIQPNEAVMCRDTIRSNRLQDRMLVVVGDLCNPIRPESVDLVVSNIAQMPLQPGAESDPHDHGGYDGWLFLDRIIKNAVSTVRPGGSLGLTVFNFLGITHRTNPKIPSVLERLEVQGWHLWHLSVWRRPVRANGKTAKSLNHIANVYPDAIFWDGDVRLTAKEAAVSNQSLSMDMSFVLVERR